MTFNMQSMPVFFTLALLMLVGLQSCLANRVRPVQSHSIGHTDENAAASTGHVKDNAAAGTKVSSDVRYRDVFTVSGHTELGTQRVWGVQADADGKCKEPLKKVLAAIELDKAQGRSDEEELKTEEDIKAGKKSGEVLNEIFHSMRNTDFERELEVGEVMTSSDINHMVECETGREDVRLEEQTSSGEEGEEVVQGDIIIETGNSSSLAELRNNISQGERWAGWLWGDNHIPYCFHPKLDPGMAYAFDHAVQWLRNHLGSCLKFEKLEASTDKKCTSTPSIMVKDNKPGCMAYMGRKYTFWNSQGINLEQGCGQLGTVLHEIGHAIGMAHEHARSDRDKHVKIHWENIQPDLQRWYKTDRRAWTGDAYETSSLMHYDAAVFISHNSAPLHQTMTDFNDRRIPNMGQRGGFTQQDLAQIKKMYGCK